MNIRAHQLVVKTPDRAIERVFAVGRDGRRRRRRRSSIVVVVGEGVVGAQRPKVRHAFRRLRARATKASVEGGRQSGGVTTHHLDLFFDS